MCPIVTRQATYAITIPLAPNAVATQITASGSLTTTNGSAGLNLSNASNSSLTSSGYDPLISNKVGGGGNPVYYYNASAAAGTYDLNVGCTETGGDGFSQTDTNTCTYSVTVSQP
ncbi:MAG: hypothetical protein ACYDDA_13535 [Acidiferrobacteraceae bacterium]